MSKNSSVIELIGEHLVNSLTKNMSRGWAIVISLTVIIASILILFNGNVKFFIYYWMFIFISVQVFNLIMKINRKRDLKKSGIAEIDHMTGIEFEEYLSLLYKGMGYKVSTTKIYGDFGADLVLEKDGQRICVQAKRYSKQVGIKAVQEVIGSLAQYSADVGWVVTNSTFTRPAIQLAKANGITLIGRNELIETIIKTKKNEKLNVSSGSVKTTQGLERELKCEICGEKMVLRIGKRGKFYGCSTFPGCKNTISI